MIWNPCHMLLGHPGPKIQDSKAEILIQNLKSTILPPAASREGKKHCPHAEQGNRSCYSQDMGNHHAILSCVRIVLAAIEHHGIDGISNLFVGGFHQREANIPCRVLNAVKVT